MKKLLLIGGWLWLLSFATLDAQEYLMVVGSDTVTPGEFEYMYTKNLDLVQDPRQKDIDYYRRLFIDYKLQLADAKALGLDKDWNFKAEYRKYRRELAKKYLIDRNILDSLVREAYDRMHSDVKVAHIMAALPAHALPRDTLKAWRKIRQWQRRLQRGEKFEAVAARYSEDPTVSQNKGHLGWINVFQTHYPFESTAYRTAPGRISGIVRTPVGYHLIKTEDRRPAVYRVQVAQIMVRKGKHPEKAREKIQEIYRQLRENPGRFAALARQYSDDGSSAKRGGLLPPFGLGQKIEPFESQAFALDTVGQISAPFETPKAWHILRLVNKEPVPPLDRIRPELEKSVLKDPERARLAYAPVRQKVRRLVPVTDETGRYRRALSYLDKSFFEGRWKLPPDWLRASEPLFTLDHDRQVTMRDFLRWLYAHQWKRPDAYRYRRAILDRLYAQFKDDMRQSYYEQHLDKWYPDFARTAREYYDGLLLFRYKSRQIWEKALKDTVGLRRFYEQNKERYRQPTRYRLVEILMPDKKRARQWYRKLKRGKMTMEDVMKLKNQGARVRLTVVEESALPGVFKKRKAQWAQTPGGQYQVRAVVDVIPTHIPPLDKIKGKVLSDYQQELEKNLLQQLRQKYPVRINENVWKRIRKKYKG